MRKISSGRRIPRQVGHDEEDDSSTTNNGELGDSSIVKRPATKLRKSTNLRKSQNSILDDDILEETSVVTPKRSNFLKPEFHQRGAKRLSTLATHLPVRNLGDEDEKPSYSAASLRELKDSTPSAPRSDVGTDDAVGNIESSSKSHALDLNTKFGSSLAQYQEPSAIPSSAEIAEKKARRARLALEEKADEYIALNLSDPELDDEDTFRASALQPKDKYGVSESRLVADDEDIMENFEDFTEDGGIALGRKAELEAARRRRQQISAQINAAEGGSDDNSEASEFEHNAAFEAAQTKHGTFVQDLRRSDPYAKQRPRTPPVISPLPTLDGVLSQLHKQLSDMQASRAQKVQEMEALRLENIRLAEEEVRIQNGLKETAEKFEAMRKEMSTAGSNDKLVVTDNIAAESEPAENSEGHESLTHNHDRRDDDDYTSLGFSGAWRGTGGLGMAIQQPSDSDDY